jgi:hypothetical protein
LGQIAPEGISGGFAEIHRPAFSTFGAAFDSVADLQLPRPGIKITYTKGTEFRSADTGIEQGQDGGLISICG